ncbi:hypothetical protein [Thalassobacillus sp. C254]|uniref:hypothetical protein n=1 Tax=Thalassobacillus sp. C254 TaxID=1225341 RepID=UPI0006CFDFB0|nr:hypothetical protein [Thalassobacillus sp. C254]
MTKNNSADIDKLVETLNNMFEGLSSDQSKNPFEVSFSARLGLLAAIITTLGDALSIVAAKAAIEEEIKSNIEAQKADKEQEEKFNNMQTQIDKIQEQLATMQHDTENLKRGSDWKR